MTQNEPQVAFCPRRAPRWPHITTKQQPDPSNDHQTTTVHDHGVLFKDNRTQKQDLRDTIFGLSRQMTRTPKKTRMENIKRTQRKRMANMEFSTSFFLSKSVLKVPRVQNSKKCGLFFDLAPLRGSADSKLDVAHCGWKCAVDRCWQVVNKMSEQQGGSQRTPWMTDDKEDLNVDSFVLRRTWMESNTVLPLWFKPCALSQTIHNKNDGRLKRNDHDGLTCTCYSWDKWQEGRKDVFSHTRVHSNVLMWPDLPILIWTSNERSVFDEYWRVDLNTSLSASRKSCTIFTLETGKLPLGHMWSRGETDESSNDFQTWSCVVWGMVQIRKPAQNREKQEWAIETPKLDNARRLRRI